MSASLSRRTLLRGTGAVLALPLLEAMVPARRSSIEAPKRIAFLYVPNGAHMEAWTPTSEGAEFALTATLEPLAKHKSKLLVLSGLTQDKARPNGDGPGDHARAAGAFLTACQALKTDGAIRAGISADQYLAREIGNLTRLRSLELGVEPGKLAGQCDSGYSCAYTNTIAWSGVHTPVGKEVDPRLVFDRLFDDGDAGLSSAERAARRERRASLLDYVRADAKRLSGRLGSNDRNKLDEYLSGVRELERRIEFAAKRAEDASLEFKRPEAMPDTFAEHAQLMCDLLALAFKSDTTRVATLMLANEGSNRSYASIGAPEGHHELSHHGGDAGKQAKVAAINRLHIEQLAHLLDGLDAANEGDGTVLDRSMIVYGSAISDGNRHNHEELPILVAGGGGTLRTGRHVRVASETPCANLWLSLLDRMGVVLPALGDSTGRLTELAS
jgi:hypothetical protein